MAPIVTTIVNGADAGLYYVPAIPCPFRDDYSTCRKG